MMKTALLALAVAATPALAGGQADSLGVGAEYMLNGIAGGVSVNYDLGKFHLGGFLGIADNGDDVTDYALGGRFFYHLHTTAMSDFSVGGGLGLYSDESVNGMGEFDRATYMFLEPSVQIRAFVAANVALSFTAGFVLAFQDADGVGFGGGNLNGDGIGGGVTGVAGVHYYFF